MTTNHTETGNMTAMLQNGFWERGEERMGSFSEEGRDKQNWCMKLCTTRKVPILEALMNQE